MTFDTFDAYNTDEAYNDSGTTAKGLVAAYKKDNPNGTKEDFYSKLNAKWGQDKDGYVKAAVNDAFKVDTPEEKIKETFVEAPKQKTTSKLTGKEKTYNDAQNARAETAKEEMLNDIEKDSPGNWEALYNSSLKRADAYKNIDDHFLESLPTFIWRRYKNGEFGNVDENATPEEKKDAKIRMAYFMINNVGTALKNASNVITGRAKEESDYEKYKNSQMVSGLENRWAKNKADTDGAIKAVEKLYGNEEDARLAAEQFTRDKKASVKWNMMDQNQKIYALEVTKKIGDMLGGMDTKELANFIAGSALTGDMNESELMAIGIAKLASSAPDILKNLPDGKLKNTVTALLNGNMTIDDLDTGNEKTAGAGGERNLKNYETIDGEKVSFDFMLNKEGREKYKKLTQDLSDKFYNGEIDAATFKKYYTPLYEEGKKHMSVSGYEPELLLKQNVWLKAKRLNDEAKKGKLPLDDYKSKFAKIKEMAKDAGFDDTETVELTKQQIADKKIKYKGPSN